jgi:uncharacterized cupredoxin-like copper-binding protein
MTTTFQKHHATMLLKYSGISFISGAVNHGFFSGERSLWTAGLGVVLFVFAAWVEHRQSDRSANSQGLVQALVWGTLLSIGLGFFTGGLQHFPDSPARSAWVVPLGFALSVLALALSAPQLWQRAAMAYALVGAVLVAVGSWGAYQWLLGHPQWAATGHSHGEEASPPAGPVAQVVSRSIAVQMDDQMRFTPATLEVLAGETIRFVVHNAGQTTHEMVLGEPQEIAAHAQAMKAAESSGQDSHHSHGTGMAITVGAGQTGELVVSFPSAMTLQMACLIPGHYEAGMRGTLKVLPAGTAKQQTPSAPPSTPPAATAHDHSNHQH